MRKLARKKQNREMMLRNLATSVIIYEKVKTTEAKAKEIKPIIDRIITIAKKNNLASHRYLLAYLLHKNAVKKLMEELIIRYKNRSSGFTRLIQLSNRVGDGSKTIYIQLLAAEKLTKNDQKEAPKEENE